MFDIYPEINNKIQSDILHYKEFSILKINENTKNNKNDIIKNLDLQYDPQYIVNQINKEDNLVLENYQLFINNFLNPSTPYNRLLINFSTGSGKSLTALTTARQYLNSNINNKVIILGFTRDIFKYELASKKIFNMLSKEDRKAYKTSRSALWKLNNKLKKNYIMYGYQGLFNNLFTYEEGSINDLKKSTLIEYISNGKIKVNKNLLDQFKNSFLICDEVHNLYNMLEPNNWAIAIMFILDYYPEIKVLFLSATPLKHSSKEIVYLINLLNEKKDRINYSDLFKNKDLISNADEIIRKKTYGKICYVNIINPLDYPLKNIVGDYLISNNNKQNNDINKHFKFIKCKITPFISNIYKKLNIENKNSNKLNIENKYIMDYIIPSSLNPKNVLLTHEEIIKEYKRTTSKQIYLTNDNIVTGECLKLENLKNISPKYYMMLKTILNILSSYKSNKIMNINGKILIFHPFVRNSGVLFIEEILKYNGFIKYNDPIHNNTLCTYCGKTRSEHDTTNNNTNVDLINNENTFNIKNHKFKPVQFININGSVNKSMVNSLLSDFNNPNNSYGENIKIIIASSMLQEGYTLKCIQHLFLTHIPINISSLQQILGRAVRKSSHSLIKEKKVNVYILTHSNSSTSISINNNNDIVTTTKESSNELTFEESYYKNKIYEYQKIQHINSILYNNAVDYQINNEINTYDDVSDLTGNITNSKITHLNNYQYIYLNQTLLILKYIIKRLFLEVSNIFEYNDLFKIVQAPPFKVSIDTSKISENHFNLAINELVYNLSANVSFDIKKDNDITDLLLDDSIIFYNYDKEEVIIKQHNNFFFLIPFNDKYKNIDNNYVLLSSSKSYDKTNNMLSKIKINITETINSNNINVKILANKIYDDLNDEIKCDNIIYEYVYDDQLKLIEYIIQSNNISSKYEKILEYYSKYNYIIYKKNKSNPIGHCFNKNHIKTYVNNKWQNDYNNSKLSFKFNKYYIFHDIVNNYIIQKLYILSNKTDSNIKDKRLIYKGTICKSVQKEALDDVLKYFKLNDDINLSSRTDKCMVLENLFLNNDKKNEYKYFLNLYEHGNLK